MSGASGAGGNLAVGSPAAGSSGSAGGPAEAGSIAAAGSGGSLTPCTGSNCPECSVNADCERRGVLGGVCADARCWPPMTPPECSADEDCTARGPEYIGGRCVDAQCRPNPRWRCEVPPPPPPSTTTTLRILLRDSLSLDPLADVRVLGCPKLDLLCGAPVAEGRTDRDGILTMPVAANFAGYLQQTDRREYAPAMYFLPASLPPDGERLQPFPLLGSGALLNTLALALGASIDPERGNLMLIAEDCFGDALAGAAFSSPQADKSTIQFYVRDLLPSPSAKETAEIGNGGFLNFPPGPTVINVTQVKTGLQLATVSIIVRKGFISVAYIRPAPRREIVP